MSDEVNKIDAQPTLPWGVVTSVVMQGLRIRMGRALVTIGGVALGTAFLMATITDRIVTHAVSAERTARAEARRMVATLTSESGPLTDRTIAVLAERSPNTTEERFLNALREESVREIRWFGPGAVKPAATRERLTQDASAIVTLGNPTVTPADLSHVRQPVIGSFTALENVPENASVVTLTRPMPAEEAAALAAAERQESVRLIWVLCVALAVTVMGVSNAMLMSVTERFREIGTMKCLGALSAFIRRVFLLEAAIVGAAGAAAGMVLGMLLPMLRYAAIEYGWGLVLGTVPWSHLALGGLAAWTVGTALALAAAVYPALTAARMVPAAALRSTL